MNLRIQYIAFISCFLLAVTQPDRCFAMTAVPSMSAMLAASAVPSMLAAPAMPAVLAVSTDDAALPDSLLTEDYTYEYTFSDFDKALRIIREMRKRKLLAVHRLDMPAKVFVKQKTGGGLTGDGVS